MRNFRPWVGLFLATAVVAGCSLIVGTPGVSTPSDSGMVALCGGKTCLSTESCVAGACVTGSCDSVTCLATELCSLGKCFPKNCMGTACASGAVCANNTCVSLSCAAVTCGLGEICEGGACVPIQCDAGACAAGAGCVEGVCLDLSCVGTRCDGGSCSQAMCHACTPSAEQCNNGTDDDCDGLIDCEDPDCTGKACTDNDACTDGDLCNGLGKCVPGMPKVCPSVGTCKTNGVCNPVHGDCSFTDHTGESCDSGNLCSMGTVCQSDGSCAGGVPKVCPTPANPQCESYSCTALSGCVKTVHTGVACDDGNQCTTGTVCQADGSCGGGTAVTCPGATQCQSFTCNPSVGCVNSIPAGTSCSTGNKCMTGEVCQSNGSCGGGSAVTCPGTSLCHSYSCSPSIGCVNVIPPGTPCASNPCVTGEVCQANGSCGGGSPIAQEAQCAFAPGSPGTPAAASQRCCGSVCVDISSDRNNCGGCGSACKSGSCETVANTDCCAQSGSNSPSTCHPTSYSGRCTCNGADVDCPSGQLCRVGGSPPYSFQKRCVPNTTGPCSGIYCPSSNCTSGTKVDMIACPDYCKP